MKQDLYGKMFIKGLLKKTLSKLLTLSYFVDASLVDLGAVLLQFDEDNIALRYPSLIKVSRRPNADIPKPKRNVWALNGTRSDFIIII